MLEPIQETLRRTIQSSECLYHRLVLLVGGASSGKSSVLRALAADLGIKVMNINLAISSELLPLTAGQRAHRLPDILAEVVENESSSGCVFLDNIEILFDKYLSQYPLRLLQGISRNRSVVAAWNGTIVDGRLSYAKPGHPEHRSYDVGDTLIVETRPL